MQQCFRCAIRLLCIATFCATTALAQTATSSDVLQKRYEAAQRFQSANDLDHAAEQYRIFIADALGEIAIGRAQAGEYDKAQDNFDEALRLVPDFPLMKLAYARAALQAGHAEHAALLCRELIQRYRGNAKVEPAAHALLGRALLKQDKNAEAKQEFEAAVALDATFENGYQLAVAELNLGDADAARKIFAEMLKSFPDTATIHMDFGQAFGNSDFQPDAVAEYRKAIAKDPKLSGVHYSLAVVLLASAGSYKLADVEAELRTEIANSPTDARAFAALGHLLAQNDKSEAGQAEGEKLLKQATVLDPTNPDSFLFLGQLLADEKQLPAAIAALRESIRLTRDPTHNNYQVKKTHYLLGRLLSQSGDTAGAKAEAAISEQLMRENLARDQNRLSDYIQENRATPASDIAKPVPAVEEPQQTRTAAAVEAFERRITPAIADSYNNLGAIAGSQQNFAAALVSFQRAAEWQPSLPGLDFNWGRAAFEAADYAQAIGPLSRYLKANPTEDGARRVLGLSQFLTADYRGARATLEPLISSASEPAKVQFAYADSLLKSGDAAAALPRLEALKTAAPPLPELQPALDEAHAALRAR